MIDALTIRGPYQGPSGYDHHVREFVRELHAQGVAIELVDLPEWNSAKLPNKIRDEWFATLQQPSGSGIVLQFCMPHQVIRYPGRSNVNFTMFEADRVPADWVRLNRGHDLLIVPTESSRQAWFKSGMPEHRVRLCPLGVNPAAFSGSAEALPLTLDDGTPVERFRVRFLNVSEFSPRKNLSGLLAAWIEGTSRDDRAVLIVKLGLYALARGASIKRQIADLEQRLGKRLADAAPTVFVYGLLSDDDMPRLYAAATHYISMSFGEGWDLPMVEAAASGLRLIAPAHSAYLGYLDDSIASLIPTREVPVDYGGDADTAELFHGAHWWQPDHQEAVARIRAAIDCRDSVPEPARERILQNFTWQQSTRRLIEILDELQQWRERLQLAAGLRVNRSKKAASPLAPPGPPPTRDSS